MTQEFDKRSAYLLAVLAVFAGGCGDAEDGPARFNVSGTVVFEGKPVAAGRIVFTPDQSKGNDGPQGFAAIRDGAYDTADSGQGTVGGPHLVEIDGFDGQPVPEDRDGLFPLGKPVFQNYQIAQDLPRQATTVDLQIPASAARSASR